MNLGQIRQEIINYIEGVILPQYKDLPGHTNAHIDKVISRSLAIADEHPELNREMVYVIAAYHDLGRLVDDETHNIESGKMMRKDENLRKFFTDEEIETMAEAVEDHRASLKGDPRSIYGKVVSSADRNMDIEDMMARSYDYRKHLSPDMPEDEIIEEARIHIRKKFGPDGYGAKKVYFPTEEHLKCFKQVDELTRDPLTWRKAVKENNKKRNK